MPVRTALVLSGGGFFGAWQAGAWSVLHQQFAPDLVVGASIGSLNGYLIASGIPPQELCTRWLDPQYARLGKLPDALHAMTAHYHLQMPFALAVTDLLRMKPGIFRDGEITWRHLAASCAIPLVLPQRRIDGRWYSDGGLLNPLPLWAAVELGATRIVALHCLPEIPSNVLKPFVTAFRFLFGHNPPVSPSIEVRMILPSQRLGGVLDAISWKRSNIEHWLALGAQDAAQHAAGPGS